MSAGGDHRCGEVSAIDRDWPHQLALQSIAELKAREEELEREWLWLVEALNNGRTRPEPSKATRRHSG